MSRRVLIVGQDTKYRNAKGFPYFGCRVRVGLTDQDQPEVGIPLPQSTMITDAG